MAAVDESSENFFINLSNNQLSSFNDCVIEWPLYPASLLDNKTINCDGIYDACHDICYVGYNEMYRLDKRWPLQYALPIYGIAFPILLMFLVTSNIFVVLVLSKKHMVSPTNTVLLYMAVADLFVGLVPAPFTIFYFTLGYYRKILHQELWWCYMSHYLMDVLPPVCHNIAIWLTVLLAFQRFMYIQYAVTAQNLCTIKNVRWASLLIVFISILSNVQKYYEVTFDIFRGNRAYYDPDIETSVVQNHSVFCINRNTIIPESMGDMFFPIYIWTRAIGFVVLPSVLLVVLNVLLIIGLRKAQERRNRLLCENRPREANRQKESNNTSLMLVMVVTIFLVVNLPQAGFFITMCIDTAAGLDLELFRTNYAYLFVMVCNMLIMATYPVNFGIYCSTSTQFRDTFKRIFCPNLPMKPDRRASTMTCYSYLLINEDGTSKTAQDGPTITDSVCITSCLLCSPARLCSSDKTE